MKVRTLLLAMLCVVCAAFGSHAQHMALKTNLIGDVALTPTLSAEVGVAPKWTLQLTGLINAWDINSHKLKQWQLRPEARYWFCQRWAGHFVGAHLIGGQFNFGHIRNNISFLGTDFSRLTDYRYQGWMGGAGLSYGYSWILSRHWNLEAEIGLGWIHTRFDEYQCADCGRKIRENLHHNYYGPTRVAVNLVCTF